MVIPRIRQTVLDTTDIRSLAEFYRQLFDLKYRPGDKPPEGPDDADWLVLTDDGERVTLAFQVDPHHVASNWPEAGVPLSIFEIDCTKTRKPICNSKRESVTAGHGLADDITAQLRTSPEVAVPVHRRRCPALRASEEAPTRLANHDTGPSPLPLRFALKRVLKSALPRASFHSTVSGGAGSDLRGHTP